MELLLVLALCLVAFIHIYSQKPKNHYPTIKYQDQNKHSLDYHKIPPNNEISFDFQYLCYLLSLIDELPQDDVILYLLLRKWHQQKDIIFDDKQLTITFINNHTNNILEDRLYNMLYKIAIDKVIDEKTLRIFVDIEYNKITNWKKDYLLDFENRLKEDKRLVDDCYSIDIYEDLKAILGYKKYLDSYKEIESEEEKNYALLFKLKEYTLSNAFVIQNINDNHNLDKLI